ncbi:MAG: hypothetical protein ACE5HB_01330 [Terriglobia bacterium]
MLNALGLSEAARAFREGLLHYRNHYHGKALEAFQRSVELEPGNALSLSYLGLLVALVQRNYSVAEQLGQEALRLRHNEAQCYVNLSEVYVRAGQRADAVECLTTGLQYTKRDARLVRALHNLGVRRRPVLRFLGRQNLLNRGLGRARHRLLGAK